MKFFFHRAAPFSLMLLLFLVLFSGCPPKEPPLHLTLTINQNFLKYVYFPEGTYWIYELDSSTGVTDSVYVTDARFNIIPYDDYDLEGYVNESVIRGISYLTDMFPQPAGSDVEGPLVCVEKKYYSDGINTNFEGYDFFSDDRGWDSLTFEPGTKISEHLDSLAINGNIYYDVITITHDTQWANNPYCSISYSKNIGVIRRSFQDGTTWSLIRHGAN